MRIQRISLWALVFGLGTAFQVWRGAPGDAVIFGVATALLIIDSAFVNHDSARKMTLDFPPVSRAVVIPSVFLAGSALYLSPIHGVIEMWLLIFIAPVLLLLIWVADQPKAIEPDAPIFFSAKVWACLGLLTTAWELLNYLLAETFNNERTYPTISDLVDPVLKNHLAKMLFILIWIFAGITFLKPVKTE